MTSSMDLSDYYTRCHKIEDNLYLGDFKASVDSEELKKENIKIILSIFDLNIESMYKNPNIVYHQISLRDDINADLLSIIPETNNIISEAQRMGHNILVHCSAGVSRSASIVIAFLMSKYKKPFKEVKEMVRSIRKKIYPNPGFIKQLTLYEEMGFTIDANNKRFRQYLIQTFILNSFLPNSVNRYFHRLAIAEKNTSNLILGKAYLCSKCGFRLCNDINVITNEDQSTGSKVCGRVYIEAQSWMRDTISDLMDTNVTKKDNLLISCPECKERVVCFNKHFKTDVCDCFQHKHIECLYFVLRDNKYIIEK